jgi:hypothetical protein
MPLSKPQRAIADDHNRFRVVIAGRRFGKSHLALRELARFARYPDQKVWYVANTRQQAKAVMWGKLKKKLSKLGWIRNINESELTVTLVNNTEITLKSAEVGDSLRGVGLNFLVCDEFANFDPNIYFEVLRPMLSDTNGHALFIGTPAGASNWARELFDYHLSRPGWSSHQYTTIQGGRVSESEITQARLDLAPRVFRQEYEASFESPSSIIFNEFGDHNIRPVDKPTNDRENIIIGIDFNTTPVSAVIGRQTKSGIDIFDEIYIDNSNTKELAEEIKTRYPNNPIITYPDPAGVQRKTSAGGDTDIKILEMAGFQTRYHRQHPLVKDRINCGNSLFFLRPDGSTRFNIDPRCSKTIKSLKSWTYKEGTMVPNKDDGFDHACDALTYAIQYLHPINKEQAPRPPVRFGHRLG